MKLMRGQFSLVQEKVHPSSAAVNKPISLLKLPDQCVLVAVIRKGTLLLPKGDTVLQEADEVLALVKSTELSQFNALLARAQ
jgi:trk system potassium uptake protein